MIARRRIVCLSSLAWAGRPTSRHHLTRVLGRTNDMLFVDPPVNVVNAKSLHRGRLIQVDERIHVLEPTPHLPYGSTFRSRLTLPTSQRLYARSVKRSIAELGWGDDVLLWTVMPVYLGARVGETIASAGHLFHMTDLAWEWPAYRPIYEQHLRRLLRSVDLGAATTGTIATKLRSYGVEVHLLPHGVDVDRFAVAAGGRVEPHPAVASIPGPRYGFVGQRDFRLDVEVLAELAAAPGSVVLVGPSDLEAVDERRLRAAGCHLLPSVGYDEVPAVLAGFDVALLPYKQTEGVAASRPLKLLEYLAAGLPVVSVDIPAARELAPHVTTVRRTEWLDATRAAAATPGDPYARINAARPHSWEARAETLSRLLEQSEARRQRRDR